MGACLVRKSYEHERVAGPNMQVVRIELKDGIAIVIPTWWHFQFDVFVPDVFLLIIHSNEILKCQPELVGTRRKKYKGMG